MTTGLIVALDDPDIHSAEILAKQLGGRVSALKIGLTLYAAHGPRVIEAVGAHGEVFYDLKLHDIPHQISGAVAALSRYGIWMFTVHLSGGLEMVRAALGGRDSQVFPDTPHKKPLVAGVTVLTSLSENALSAVGQGGDVSGQVQRLARLGVEAGVDALVCSPHEIETVRSVGGDEVLLVVPGIRPADAKVSDQARAMTPKEAAQLGADFIVVGRPITLSPDPVAASQKILDEIG